MMVHVPGALAAQRLFATACFKRLKKRAATPDVGRALARAAAVSFAPITMLLFFTLIMPAAIFVTCSGAPDSGIQQPIEKSS